MLRLILFGQLQKTPIQTDFESFGLGSGHQRFLVLLSGLSFAYKLTQTCDCLKKAIQILSDHLGYGYRRFLAALQKTLYYDVEHAN
jgi:hypothetical protein